MKGVENNLNRIMDLSDSLIMIAFAIEEKPDDLKRIASPALHAIAGCIRESAVDSLDELFPNRV